MIAQLKQKNNSAAKEFHHKFYNARAAVGLREYARHETPSTAEFADADVSRVKQLMSNRILTALPDQIFARLLPHLEPIALRAGEALSKPNEEVRFVYFAENAVVSHLHILATGSTTETAMLGKDAVIGLCALFGNYSPAHWAEVVIGGSAFRIRTDLLKAEFKRSAALQTILLEHANTHIAQISQKAVCNIHHMAEERLCNWLLMLHDRFGGDSLPLTHDQIARYLGVHRPSVTHIAMSLRTRGLIDYVRGHVKLLDRAKLESAACECYAHNQEIVGGGEYLH